MRRRLKSPASRLFTRPFIQAQIKENLKLRVTGLCAGYSPVTGEFPAQMASNAENVSIDRTEHIDDSAQLINLLLLSHCFLSHFTPQYPQLTMPFHSTTIFTLVHLLPLSLAHLPQKYHLNFISSITKALLKHTLASFWGKQSCYPLCWYFPLHSI